MRFEVIPFKFVTSEILFKVQVTRANSLPPTLPPPPSRCENIEMLKKVSQKRPENRTIRPKLFRDRVHYQLIEDVFEIFTNTERLWEKLADVEASLKGLIRKQLSLEEDIEVKANSLLIDRDQCMELCKQINHIPHLKGYFRRYASTTPSY